MLKYLVQALLFCLLLQGQAFAQNIDFMTMHYPYNKDKRVIVSYEYAAEAEDFRELQLESVLRARLDKELVEDKKVSKIGMQFVVEGPEQRAMSDEAYNDYVEKNFDAQLKVTVKELKDLVVTTPPYSYDVPHTVYRTVMDSNGNVYSYPVTWYEHVYVPEATQIFPYCEVSFELRNVATGEMLWNREVSRERGSSGIFTSRNQGFHDTFDYLVKKFLQDYKKQLLSKRASQVSR